MGAHSQQYNCLVFRVLVCKAVSGDGYPCPLPVPPHWAELTGASRWDIWGLNHSPVSQPPQGPLLELLMKQPGRVWATWTNTILGYTVHAKEMLDSLATCESLWIDLKMLKILSDNARATLLFFKRNTILKNRVEQSWFVRLVYNERLERRRKEHYISTWSVANIHTGKSKINGCNPIWEGLSMPWISNQCQGWRGNYWSVTLWQLSGAGRSADLGLMLIGITGGFHCQGLILEDSKMQENQNELW